ncbi:alpha/beta hydrolase [Mesorhizobium sp.]|uniref:alpha/beta hydrolase n=1 Tax=Mesorhizobium sp. TaxID=1871066 RepID=UPI000FE4401A|nr:alpha/beta hydrolase [Mesorhizobium sp.]RWA76377.1 MAG: alpha/beta hydrolase [Mesorhizobium sp.]RWC04072.1 MAG: alpha/beta hydrolase [Mesorhizobium sp.]RWG87333.1 MAG: alpha/beta hydrolase [Mesorhizobium sp.]RWG90767.1 MAG: alpha/beta hydrolase [Mesorhizobium sp.]RWK10610.1 MAG: alpha/beta hydrolase [Mesorhizobium sp.]
MTKDPYRIRDHVAEFDDIVAEIVRLSAEVRLRLPMVADIAYGPDATETVDLFFPEGKRDGLPVHMFIHGGYWRMFSKRDYSYIAETVTRAGAIAVIVDYALMPAVRMAAIVDQVRRAQQWVLACIAQYGGDPERLTVSGHSAGAHLATMLLGDGSRPSKIKGALLLSGLYDLEPLQTSFLAAEIGITGEEVASFSPLTHRFDPAVAVEIAVGAEETAPFHRQAEAFALHLQEQGLRVRRTAVTNANHMSIVRDMGLLGTDAAGLLEDLVSR